MVRRFAVVLLLALPALAGGATPSSITITSSANPSVFGQAVTLTATVSPSAATGMVTFYDGTTVLGSHALAVGQGAISTILIASGSRTIQAFYGGDAAYSASTSAILPQTVNAVPGSGFQAQVHVGTGASGPNFAAVGDFNGDGKADLAVVNYFGGTVSVLLGNGDGTFEAAMNFDAGEFPRAIAVGDFNGDGKQDLAVGNDHGEVIVLLGNGDGTFRAPVSYTVGGHGYGVAVADFNRDGKADLVVAEADGGGSVLLGNGDGTFGAPVNYAAGAEPISVAVGDFNGDGKADAAFADYHGASVSVLLGNGDGTLRAAALYHVNVGPQGIATGDFNGDGKADLVTANYEGNSVSVLLGKGDGTFQTAVNYGAHDQPVCVAVSDFNGDGVADLAVDNASTLDASVLLGRGDGTFQAAMNYGAGNGSHVVVVADFNGDGRADLAVNDFPGNNMSVLLAKVASGDITPPVVSLVQTIAGPPKKVQLGSTDAGSGLASVTVLKCTNCNPITEPFAPGTHGTILTTATKIDQSRSSSVKLQATDVAGNVTVFDPTDLTVESEGKPSVSTAEISPREYIVQIVNGTPGIHTLRLAVNGMKIPIFFLKNGETRTINIRHALLPGQPNTVKVTAFGRPGGSTWIVFTEP